MTQLTFHELQSYLALKYQEGRTSSALFMKLVEEIGEVAEVLNQLEGRKENHIYVVSHDGTINSYREFIRGEKLTREDFLTGAGWVKQRY
ncbi:hypothetical protein [Bacillus sp. es.034]|uniref:hypothetical protein n=1 Tax=Bacillus sp. es.034 TaxID=1761763 RepID=UPI000BF977F9|nr:hypothetical protein [Bacillus sp. es.034]PFG05344.1 hypothetical protein ATG71_2176 [Bacillus sp. es.034]